VYVTQQFPPSSKQATVQMVHDIEAAMDQDLDTLDWMSAATKVKAKEKLHAIADKIGYPTIGVIFQAQHHARRRLRQLTTRVEFENRRQLARSDSRGSRRMGISPRPSMPITTQHERHQFSRRHPAIAVLDPKATDAENYGTWAASSVMNSPTASTTKAASLAQWQSLGLVDPEDAKNSKKKPTAKSRNTAASSPSTT